MPKREVISGDDLGSSTNDNDYDEDFSISDSFYEGAESPHEPSRGKKRKMESEGWRLIAKMCRSREYKFRKS